MGLRGWREPGDMGRGHFMERLACQAQDLLIGCHWSASCRKIDLVKPEAEKFNRPMQMPGRRVSVDNST